MNEQDIDPRPDADCDALRVERDEADAAVDELIAENERLRSLPTGDGCGEDCTEEARAGFRAIRDKARAAVRASQGLD